MQLTNFEKFVSIRCSQRKSIIHYNLSTPFSQSSVFEFYYLVSVPQFVRSEHTSPSFLRRFILQKDNRTFASSSPCNRLGNATYYCSKSDFIPASACQSQALKNDVRNCPFRQQTMFTPVSKIPFLNAHIVITQKPTKVTFYCPESHDTRFLTGIYYIQPSTCNISINGSLIYANATPSYSVPIFTYSFVKATANSTLCVDSSPQANNFMTYSCFLSLLFLCIVSSIYLIFISCSQRCQANNSPLQKDSCTTTDISATIDSCVGTEMVEVTVGESSIGKCTKVSNVEPCHISTSNSCSNETPVPQENWRLPGNLPVKSQFSI